MDTFHTKLDASEAILNTSKNKRNVNQIEK